MQNIKSLAYQGHPIAFQVLIAEEDVTDMVAEIEEISLALDYPQLNSYRPGDGTIILNDPDGYFSKENASNFFIHNDLPQSGNGVAVSILAGYVVDGAKIMETILDGKITKVSQDAGPATTTLVVSDQMDDLFSKEIEDFGIERHFRLELSNATDIHGNYPMPDFALPASKGSIAVEKNGLETYNEVEELSETGSYDRDNYVVDEEGVKSEYVEFVDATDGYPRFRGKTAYRNKDVESAVLELLDHIEITEREVVFPKIQRPLHLSKDERIGYRVLGTPGTSEPPQEELFWKGYPTDIIFDDGAFYIAYNSPPDVREVGRRNPSMLLKYVIEDDERSIIYSRNSTADPPRGEAFGTEFWGIAKEGDKIAILCTDSLLNLNPVGADAVPDELIRPVAGSYDASEYDVGTNIPANRCYILLFDESDSSVMNLVPQTADAKPQIASHYIFGSTPDQEVGGRFYRQSVYRVRPDTHKSFVIRNGNLYYPYVESTDNKHYGVARVAITGGAPQKLWRAESDGVSHMGFGFVLENNTIYILSTHKDGGSSQVLVASVSA